MTENEQKFIQQLDVITQSCRIRNTFVKLWRRQGINHALRYTKILSDKQRQEINNLINELGIL